MSRRDSIDYWKERYRLVSNERARCWYALDKTIEELEKVLAKLKEARNKG